ncbi:sodium-dependent neutral amino acid transporter B(0)AT2 [Aplysia californica]|uniref:Sodium-dependent neutral amino acid transporter B(0)AT2 n=1 Tax=Aplysia californica TaxID=6500 RepID=A0ABM1AA34_APLCA|nr:sodium-dependent neutral amino acid transporter B(0)AT2 [Aplysia californica]
MMLGYPPGLYWLLSWRYVMPMCIVIIIVSTIIDVSTKGVFYHSWNPELAEAIYLPWPWWCMFLAGILILLSIIWIPVVALTTYLSGRGLLKQDKPTNFPLETLKRERGLSSTERPPSSRFQKVILGFED